MKVIAQTAALQEALNLAGSIVATRTPKPVLQCIKLVAANKMLTLMSTDLEVGCRYQVTAVQIKQEGEALVPAERLVGIVRESPDDESITLDVEKDTFHIRGGSSHFKIFGYDPGEYPAVAEFTGDADFSISSSVLAKMIGKTLFATAKAHSHYAISGVLWEATGKRLQLVATDGHRLAQARGNLIKPAGRDVTAIVPGKLMGLIQRVCGGADEALDVKILENQILVRTSRAVLVSSLVQGNFPRYSDVIPKDTTRKAIVATGLFEHRIRQAALLTNEESRGVRLSFKNEMVVLSSRAPETGEAEVNCPITYEGELMDIAFNPGFLLDALRVAETDKVSLEMNASNKPAMLRAIKPDGDDKGKASADFLYVLMPVDLG